MPESLTPVELAVLDALGEATAEQQAKLRVECDRDPQLSAEHRRLLAEIPLADSSLATSSLADDPVSPLPKHILHRLAASRRKALESRRGDAAQRESLVPFPSSEEQRATAGAAGAVARVAPSSGHPWKRRMRSLALAAAVVLVAGLSALWLWRHEGKANSLPIALSPSGETIFTRPTLVWDGMPGQRYDVWVLPSEGEAVKAPALFIANNVTSPLPFGRLVPKGAETELQGGKDYRLLVCLANAGRLGGVARPFRVSAGATATTPAPKTADAALAVMRRLASEGKEGDALTVFASLPAEIRQNAELAAYEAALRATLRAGRKQ